MTGSAGLIPIVHAATESRPDEIDTITAARCVAEAVARLGYATEIVALEPDLAGLEALPARRPLLVFNLADAVGGLCGSSQFIDDEVAHFCRVDGRAASGNHQVESLGHSLGSRLVCSRRCRP